MISALSRSLAYAEKKGCLKVYITGAEKYNNNAFWDGDPETPKADGSFEVEGHTWTDMNTQYRLELLNPVDREFFCLTVWFYFKDLKDAFKNLTKNFSFKGLLETLHFALVSFDSVSTIQSRWTLSIASFGVARGSFAEEKAFEELAPMPEDDRDFIVSINNPSPEYKAWHAKMNAKEAEILAENQDLTPWLKDTHTEVRPGLWVGIEDPGLFYADEAVFPFDMKSGWSNQAIIEIVNVWLKNTYRVKFGAVESEEMGGNQLTRKLRKALFTVKGKNGN